ncbi:hypothetical protein PA598K_01422 [Paenibacillus sp. 598K]|uniref:hypothetical protein n=1 Tax=Paenibacillus sp. 598K TaxID=1117987 RepID=UPI000FF96CB6|nr:hypothetical protein [Paenibacillus sp. 598K]GBF73137.1 hypothetical protein PA598K_01422 [Paenibacillus sp. 598K]
MGFMPPFSLCGCWEVWDIKTKYLSPRWAQLSCRQWVVNGPTEIKNIIHTPLDRLLGIDFDSKVLRETDKFIAKMKAKNEQILRLKDKEKALSEVIKIRY